MEQTSVTSADWNTSSDAVTNVTTAVAAVVTSLLTTVLAEMTSQPTSRAGFLPLICLTTIIFAAVSR